jgi:MoaA/NifB/PqqE/SkfB family radical SAM enzyme
MSGLRLPACSRALYEVPRQEHDAAAALPSLFAGVFNAGDCDSVTDGEVVHFQTRHFRESLPTNEARELFRDSVRLVEIETFSFCNRKCWFCPNAAIPSRQDRAANQYMDEELYLRIIDELASVDYRGHVQFGRYNEPLADRIILMRLRQASDRLPRAWLYLHTNGDFLTREYLEELCTVGLNGLALQTYLGNDQHWDEQAMKDRQRQQLNRLGLQVVKKLCSVPGFRHHYVTDFPGVHVTIDARNFDRIGTDRGGLVEIQRDRPRTAPCLMPFRNMYIDWPGNVMPCCNLRSDVPEHAQHIACRLQDGHSIFDAFTALHGWRKNLMRFGPKTAPCATCRMDEDLVPTAQAGELARLYDLIEAPLH